MKDKEIDIEAIKADADLIFSAQQISLAIDRMALKLTEKINHEQAIIICVMNGGLMLMSDLMRKLESDLRMDYLQVARYRDQTVGGSLHWHKEPQLSLQDQVVILVDDIYDEGFTLEEVVSYCKRKGARKVITAVLLFKEKENRSVTMQPDVYGLEVVDRYVFGYGMDYKGALRNLPAIYAIKE